MYSAALAHRGKAFNLDLRRKEVNVKGSVKEPICLGISLVKFFCCQGTLYYDSYVGTGIRQRKSR